MMGIRNNSHCGALAYYVQMALNAGMAAMVMVNTDACVVPFGGRKAFFGTNPFAFGFPGKKESILLDMATSEVAFGKIFYAREKEQPIPAGWAVGFPGEPHDGSQCGQNPSFLSAGPRVMASILWLKPLPVS